MSIVVFGWVTGPGPGLCNKASCVMSASGLECVSNNDEAE